MERGPGLLLETMLHFGTLAAVILTFPKDIIRICLETVDMLCDMIGNVSLYIHNHKTGDRLRYAKIISSTYKKFALLVWVSMIPTALLGYTARRLAALASHSKLIPRTGILITGILLLVVDFSRLGGHKAARDADSEMPCGLVSVGTFCVSGTFQKRTYYQCGINEWIYPQLCSEIFLYYFNTCYYWRTLHGIRTVCFQRYDNRLLGIYLCVGDDRFCCCQGILPAELYLNW